MLPRYMRSILSIYSPGNKTGAATTAHAGAANARGSGMVSKTDKMTMKETAFEAGKLALIKTQNEQVKEFAQTDTFDAKELNGFAAAMEPSSSI
jgi:predicted outer membrane protein